MNIRMSPEPLAIGTRFWGDKLVGDKIHGKPFEIVAKATRAEFVAQFAAGEMTAETSAYLDSHPALYFYRTRPLRDPVGLLAEIDGT